jgi:hypothetical protein
MEIEVIARKAKIAQSTIDRLSKNLRTAVAAMRPASKNSFGLDLNPALIRLPSPYGWTMPKQSGLYTSVPLVTQYVSNSEPRVSTVRPLMSSFLRSSGILESRHSCPRARRFASTIAGGSGESIVIVPIGSDLK